MSTNVKPIPDGYRSITPYLTVQGGKQAIDFYKKVFGAKEIMRIEFPNGIIGHAELFIGDSTIMLADECPEMAVKSPKTGGSSGLAIHLYTENVDAVIELALSEGSTQLKAVENQFYGDRSGSIIDPFGHVWHIATHIEDVPHEELYKRAEALMKPQNHQ